MTGARILARVEAFRRVWLPLAVLAILAFAALPGAAQEARYGSGNIPVALVADGPPVPGETWTLALHFTPTSEEWHGYWSNPGDAGQGMSLQWRLPDGWEAGEPVYPVPRRLVISGLMNHVYEGEHTVLVPIRVPGTAAVANPAPISVFAEYLACTDKICVPQDALLTLDPARAAGEPRFDGWRAAIAPQLDSEAGFEITGERLRIGIPLPASMEVAEPHVFVGADRLGGGLRPRYAERQTFIRDGDLLVAEIPLRRIALPDGDEPEPTLRVLSGILAFGDGAGVRFSASPRDVPLEGVAPMRSRDTPPLWTLVLAALAGGLLLNVMPCVFPILSLKALALAKAGADGRSARADALAYTAGVVLACLALGAALLVLRSAGENVGWAFQLQEPAVVVALLLLATAITANFLGLFEVPGMAISGGSGTARGSFSTGLLAAFVATPCTGPFMAAALGAALLLPPLEALLLFGALGLGLALPFLLVGCVPALRSLLPRPGAWMAAFRRWMALPMGLTALALAWLVWRIGGSAFLFGAAALVLALVAILWGWGRSQRRGGGGALRALAALGGLAIAAALLMPPAQAPSRAAESLLDPMPFTEAALAEARASGQPVFLWFTADWCVTCKVNEGVAIEREATKAAFEEAGVIALRGDWTRRETEIASFLTRHGAAGVPLYLWYEPGGEAERLPQVLTTDMLVAKATGGGISNERPTPNPPAR